MKWFKPTFQRMLRWTKKKEMLVNKFSPVYWCLLCIFKAVKPQAYWKIVPDNSNHSQKRDWINNCKISMSFPSLHLTIHTSIHDESVHLTPCLVRRCKEQIKVTLQGSNVFCCHGSHQLGWMFETTLLYNLWSIFNIILSSASSHLEILVFLGSLPY